MPSAVREVLGFEAPEWPLPSAVTIHGEGAKARLCVVSDGTLAPEPHPGCWRSLAELDGSADQIVAVAGRYGSLTAAAWEAAGEPLQLWHRLIEELRLLAPAWNADGKLCDAERLARARFAALGMHQKTVAEHNAAGGGFLSSAFTVRMPCRDLATYWRRSAIADVAEAAAMRPCRYCTAWMSSRGWRADAGFCSTRCRSAFHQGRKPKSDFWAEA